VSKPRRVARLTWIEAVAHDKHGAPHPQMRHVLLTLALHMNAKGASCFPSQGTVAKRTLLNERVVRRHLAAAEAAGWIRRVLFPRKHGLNWRRHKYFATVPASFPVAELVAVHAVGQDTLSAPSTISKGEDRNDTRDRTPCPLIPPTRTLSEELRERGSIFSEESEHGF